MKIRSVIFNPFIRLGLAGLGLVMGINSCSTIWTDQEECPEGASIRFVYDHNMEFADAFNSKVHCLSVLVFDEAGNYITTLEETGEVLQDKSYNMSLDLAPGDYTLVTYGGLACEDRSFDIPVFGTRGSYQLNDLTAEMNHNNYISDEEKHAFYHGSLDLTIHENKISKETVYLKKNTNNIKIVLQQINGDPISASQFSFMIKDDNTRLDAENNVIPNGEITYLPWTSGESVIGSAEDGETPISAAYAEFSTSRLTTGTSPKLIVRNIEKDKDVINIPLNTYLLFLRSDLYKDMDPQEFLDRESEWSLVFFLDPGHRWIDTHIVVNDWIVRLNDVVM